MNEQDWIESERQYKARIEELESLSGEAYVIVAAMADALGIIEHPLVEKAMGNFFDAEKKEEVLPFDVAVLFMECCGSFDGHGQT